MTSARGSITAILAPIVAATGLMFGAAPAAAAPAYGLIGSFGSASTSPSDPNPLTEPDGVAVNQSSGDVYVIDKGNNRVQKFNASGDPENFTVTAPYINENKLTGTPTETFASSGFGSVPGIAVDNSCYYHGLTGAACETSYPSNGDVYVSAISETGQAVIDKFSEIGEYIGGLTGLGPSGSIVPFPGTPLSGVAVDQEGNVWIYETKRPNGYVDECNDVRVNECLSKWSTEHETSRGFAVDSADNVYAVTGGENVLKLSGTGSSPLVEEVTNCSCGSALAVDGSNDLFVAEITKVAEYGAPVEPPEPPESLSPIHEFGEGPLARAQGIAVSATGAVYVADSANNDVDIFGLGEPAGEAPLTEAASPPTPISALLHGTLRPAATKVRYYFEYSLGANCAGGATTPVKESEGAVSEEVTGLNPGTLYTFCLVAAYGHLSGSEEHFTTSQVVEGVSKCAATGVTGEDATLEASLEPKGTLTEYHFEYGTSLPGSNTKIKSSELSGGVVTDSEHVTNLEPKRRYECRLLATREIKGKPYTQEGEIGTFTTPAQAPAIIDGLRSYVGPDSAVLYALIDPKNSATTYYIEYVEAMLYCPSCADPYEHGGKVPEPPQPEAEVGSDDAYHTLKQTVRGLAPNTTYHYRMVATNYSPGEPGTGTSCGEDETFTTGTENPRVAPVAPMVITGTASVVSQTAATLSGSVNPEGYATSYAFEVGTSVAYGTDISGTLAGNGTEAQSVTLALADLAPLTTYHYRLAATNANGTSYGQDQSFTTTGTAYSLTLPFAPPLIAVPAIAFPASSQASTGSTGNKKLTNAQKLTAALKTCRTKKKGKRAGCERRARKQYAPAKAEAKTKHN